MAVIIMSNLETLIHSHYYFPRGYCWYYDSLITILHGPPSLLTFLSFIIISIVSLYIYRTGRLSKVDAAYPKLWRVGSMFMITCSLSQLGNFIEIWWGGGLYWITGINKVCMAISSLIFARLFWKSKDDLALTGRVMARVAKLDKTPIDLDSTGSWTREIEKTSD